MSVKIDEKIIEDMAILSKLNLNQLEVEEIKEEMQKIVEYVDKLKEIDTDIVKPMTSVVLEHNVFREDIVLNDDQREKILANAPEKENNSFVVPKTFD